MLKIANINVRVKCPKHKSFNPSAGPGAVKGGCVRCNAMVQAHQLHVRLMSILVNELHTDRTTPKPRKRKTPQLEMFPEATA